MSDKVALSSTPVLPQKQVLLGIGIPGSGKTTWLRNRQAGKPTLFLDFDQIRREETGTDKFVLKDVKKIWQGMAKRLIQALQSSDPQTNTIVLDGTFYRPPNRRFFLKILKRFAQTAHLKVIEFQTDLQTALNRQATRPRKVPLTIIERMASKLIPFSPQEADGLSVDIERITPGTPLPQPEQPVVVAPCQTAAQLESQLSVLGFWKEEGQWQSGWARKLQLPPSLINTTDPVLAESIAQLLTKGFAEAQPLP